MTKTSNREYIDAAYALISEVGIENVTIRQVADKVGVSSASLYRHFDNLDHLLALASVRFLKDYSADASFLARVDLNPMELDFELWECFAFYAFQNVPVFENLFFWDDPDRAQQIVLEYYSVFPEDLTHVREYIFEMLREGNLFRRDYYVMSQAVASGMITEESAQTISKTVVYMFRGMLQAYKSTYVEEGVPAKATREFMGMLSTIYNNALLPGNTILVRDPDYLSKARSQVDATGEARVSPTDAGAGRVPRAAD